MAINYKVKIVVTTPYTVQADDEVIMVDIPGPASVILPASGGSGDSKRSLYLKDYSGNAKNNPITITALSNKTIDGVSFAILNQGYSHIQVVYDGTNWMTIA